MIVFSRSLAGIASRAALKGAICTPTKSRGTDVVPALPASEKSVRSTVTFSAGS